MIELHAQNIKFKQRPIYIENKRALNMKAKSKLKSYFCGEEKKCQNYALPLGRIQFACVTKIPRKKAIILKAFLRFSPGKKKTI